MNHSPQNTATVPTVKQSFPRFKKHFSAWIMLGLLLTLCVARVEGQDDDYLAVYGLIDQADALNASGKTARAHYKYIEAKQALVAFQQNYPTWNSSTVGFRLKYLDDQIAATKVQAAAPSIAPANPAPATPMAVPPPTVTDMSSPVKLLDAGSEPRTVLRLHPVVGDKQTLSMSMKMAMTMTMVGNQMPAMDLPAMQMTMAMEVKDISADGEITYGVDLSDATIGDSAGGTPGVAAAMQSALAGMKGMTGTGRVSSKGVVEGVEMKLPAGASPQLSQTLEQMKDSFSSSSTVLPEEAVGPGAKWEYKTKVKSQGMSVDQTIDYELVSIDGDQLTLRSTLTQSAANQTVENPAVPGIKVNLTSLAGTSAGTSTFNLGHIMPQQATLDGNTDMSMSMNMGQQPQSMSIKMKMDVTLETK